MCPSAVSALRPLAQVALAAAAMGFALVASRGRRPAVDTTIADEERLPAAAKPGRKVRGAARRRRDAPVS